MAQVAVTARDSSQVFLIKAHLSLSLAHLVAEAYTPAVDHECPIQDLLGATFGRRTYARYAIDMSTTVWCVTFSASTQPGLLTFNKIPAQIVSPDWTLWLQDVDLVRPGRLNPTARHPHFAAY